MILLKSLGLVVAACALAIVLARFAFPLPPIAGRPPVQGLETDDGTELGRLAAEAAAEASPGKTGIAALAGGRDAFGSRLALAGRAERSIDAQYYIWRDDTSGLLLLEALYAAARRGVRVRLLLDDNGIPGLDDTVAALNALPGFEIRLFNPSTVRRPKFLGYAFDFFRMNRRMHNKSFIVDGAAAIIGGRNIGDEYFEIGEGQFFLDLDVLAIGAIVPETVDAFDAYWNSASAYQADLIVSGEEGGLDRFLRRADAAGRRAEADIREITSADLFAGDEIAFEWTDVALVSDDPAKGLGEASRDQLMISRLGAILGRIDRSLDLVSAYFIPGAPGTAYFAELAASGVDVRVLTNALQTTDVALVHAGYVKYRDELLSAGIGLFELKPDARATDGRAELGVMGSSGASLHAKTFALDRDRIFIGSFNFDPRSAMLNCEMGFLIDSSRLAGSVADAFDDPVGEASYQVVRTPGGELAWRERLADGTTVEHAREPGTTLLSRAGIALLGWLPIEWLL